MYFTKKTLLPTNIFKLRQTLLSQNGFNIVAHKLKVLSKALEKIVYI